MSTFIARPEVAAPPAWRFPAISESTLGNGIRLLRVHLPGQYVTSSRLVVQAPIGTEPDGADGVALLTSRTLDEGTAVRSGEEFAAAVERQGAHYGAWVFDAGVHVGIDVAAGRLGPALALLAEAVTQPAFPDSEIARHVALRIGEIEQDHADPGALAHETFSAQVFDAAARLSRPVGGTATSVAALDRAVVQAYYEATYAPARATLVVSGDLTGVDVEALADAALGSWTSTATADAALTEPIAAAGPKLVVVDRPGAVQTELVIGCPGPDRTDSAWAEHVLAARIVGGTITSRLDAELREEKGYTYGIRAAFSPYARGGVFSASGSVRTEVTGAALSDALRILATARDGFTDLEVADAAGYLTRMAPLRYETAADITSQIASNIGNGVGADFVDRHQAALAAVTPAGAAQAYARSVPPGGLTVVAVGDATAIEAQLGTHDLSAYGLGDVVRV
jgi:zinc protease